MARGGRLVLAGAVIAVALAGVGVWRVSSGPALGFTDTGGGGQVGLPVVKNLDASSYDVPSDVPYAYGWHRGGYVFMG